MDIESDKRDIKFRKYNSKNELVADDNVDRATFSVVRTTGCNSNENNNNSGNVKDLFLGDTKMTDVYNSRKTGEDVKTTVSVGGIPAGTTLSELTNMSLGEVIDRMLFKTTYPFVKTAPSASVNYSPVDILVGEEFRKVVTGDISVSKGNYGLEQDGTVQTREVVSNGFESFTATYTPDSRIARNGENKINVAINLKSGPTPLDSEGNPYTRTGIPYIGGTINKTITIYPYYNWYATGKKISSETEQTIDYTATFPLTSLGIVRSMGIHEVTVMLDISNGDINHRHTIKVPGTISNVKVYTQGTWKDYAFDEWYEQVNPETINYRIYHVYKMKESAYTDGAVGGTRLKFTVTP